MFGRAPYATEPYGAAPLAGATQAFRAMPGATKRTAIVPEVTQGTTPATPGFLIVRDIRVEGELERGASVSPERKSDRSAMAMTKGLSSFVKTIEMPYVRDAATDELWASAFCSTWAADVLKNGSTKAPFTLEERYDGEPSPMHRRLAGCIVDEVALVMRAGSYGRLRYKVRGLAESFTYDPLDGATYAAPTPGYDPVTPAAIETANLFSLTNPRVIALSLMIRNNTRDRHKFGAVDPFGNGLGAFRIAGSVELYFTDLREYTVFMERQRGLGLNLLIGSETGAKDRLQMTNVDVWNPDVTDPGSEGEHVATLNFVGKYSPTDDAVAILTRNLS